MDQSCSLVLWELKKEFRKAEIENIFEWAEEKEEKNDTKDKTKMAD